MRVRTCTKCVSWAHESGSCWKDFRGRWTSRAMEGPEEIASRVIEHLICLYFLPFESGCRFCNFWAYIWKTNQWRRANTWKSKKRRVALPGSFCECVYCASPTLWQSNHISALLSFTQMCSSTWPAIEHKIFVCLKWLLCMEHLEFSATLTERTCWRFGQIFSKTWQRTGRQFVALVPLPVHQSLPEPLVWLDGLALHDQKCFFPIFRITYTLVAGQAS